MLLLKAQFRGDAILLRLDSILLHNVPSYLFEKHVWHKVFSFCILAFKNWKLRSYDKNRNHDYRVNQFMRNDLNWDNHLKEIYQKPMILSMLSFTVCVLCIFNMVILVLYFAEKLSERLLHKKTKKTFRIILTTCSKISQIEATKYR